MERALPPFRRWPRLRGGGGRLVASKGGPRVRPRTSMRTRCLGVSGSKRRMGGPPESGRWGGGGARAGEQQEPPPTCPSPQPAAQPAAHPPSHTPLTFPLTDVSCLWGRIRLCLSPLTCVSESVVDRSAGRFFGEPGDGRDSPLGMGGS